MTKPKSTGKLLQLTLLLFQKIVWELILCPCLEQFAKKNSKDEAQNYSLFSDEEKTQSSNEYFVKLRS
jgi:hypothetical protein